MSAPVENASCITSHVDGMLYTVGTSNGLSIYDTRTGKKSGILTSQEQPNCISFNENGYLICSGHKSNCTVWDLRNLSSVANLNTPDGCNSARFDYSGKFLAYSNGASITLSAVKQYTPLIEISEHKSNVTSIVWGNLGKSIYSSALDKTIKSYQINQ